MKRKDRSVLILFMVLGAAILLLTAVLWWDREWNASFLDSKNWTLTARLDNVPVVPLGYSFSPDSKYLATAGADGKVRIYEAATGKAVKTFDAQHYEPREALYSRDGKKLLTRGTYLPLNVWDTGTYELLAQSEATAAEILGEVSWSHDSTKILALVRLTRGRYILIWDARSLELLAKVQGHTDFISSAAFSPAEPRFASVSWDTTVRIWDAETFETVAVLKGHRERVVCLGYSPDGRYLATGGVTSGEFDTVFGSENVVVWDTKALKAVQKLRHYHIPDTVLFTPDGRRLMTKAGAHVYFWDPVRGRYLGKRRRDECALEMAKFCPAGLYAATMSRDDGGNGVVYLLRRKPGK